MYIYTREKKSPKNLKFYERVIVVTYVVYVLRSMFVYIDMNLQI